MGHQQQQQTKQWGLTTEQLNLVFVIIKLIEE